MMARMTIWALAALALSAGAALAATPAPVSTLHAPTPLKPAAPVRIHHAPVAAPDGAVASLVNVEGLRPGQLVLSGRILADIYSGKITRWDAPQIAHWNPGVALPHAAIVVIRPQETSPTTFAFTGFLAAQSEIGRTGAAVPTLTGMVAGRDDAAVASAVRGTENSIGYVDYRYAMQNGLAMTKVITREGVSPILAAPKSSAAMIASRGDVIAPMRATSPAMAPTLGKLSFIANPPSVLGQLGKSGDGRADDRN